MKPTPLKTPSQSGRPDSQHDSLRHQATDRDTSNQPLRDDDDTDDGTPGATGPKGRPGQRGAQDEKSRSNTADELPGRQNGMDSASEADETQIYESPS